MRLGEMVIEQGLASADAVERGLARARETGARLGSALIELGLVDADAIATVLAQQLGVPAARAKHLTAIAPETRALLSPATCARWCAVPIALTAGEAPSLVVAMRDPGAIDALDALAQESGYPIRPAIAAERRIRAALVTEPVVARPVEAPLELAPRTRPASTAPPIAGRARPASTAPPIAGRTRAASTAPPEGSRLGGAAARLAAAAPVVTAPTSSPLPRLLVGLALAAAVIGGGVWWFTRGGGEEVVGRYASPYVGATIDLPGMAWHTDPDSREAQGQGGAEMRIEMLYRGAKDDPDQVAVIGRATTPGQLPTSVNMTVFKQMIDAIGVQLSAGRFGGMALGDLRCELSDARTEPIGACRGVGDLGSARYGVVMYLWIANANDLFMVLYAERGALRRDDEAVAIVRSLRLR
jgi:hypothetical protein